MSSNTAYYVSVIDGRRSGLLLGPYDTHEDALAQVERVRSFVVERDARAHFYGFGTASLPSGNARPGRLNAAMAGAGS